MSSRRARAAKRAYSISCTDEDHEQIRARARRAGQSISDYLVERALAVNLSRHCGAPEGLGSAPGARRAGAAGDACGAGSRVGQPCGSWRVRCAQGTGARRGSGDDTRPALAGTARRDAFAARARPRRTTRFEARRADRGLCARAGLGGLTVSRGGLRPHQKTRPGSGAERIVPRARVQAVALTARVRAGARKRAECVDGGKAPGPRWPSPASTRRALPPVGR